ncbi:Coiled-coil domain-containing protein 43 [Eumeta japonica]|uniref:Coiled-coil domain-containing protein 43 n=1 Tax=Eumeta variegata TaxID=151549 RepID=A0A4C1Y6C8_EUMVA|nr:Coiled-coil domain-containing protein 43 [Eumeta japonica]
MAASVGEFEPWLNDKLKSLNTDEGVFGSYISGILDGEDSIDDKKDALEGILSEFVESDIAAHVTEILEKWSACQPKEQVPKHATDVDVQLAKLMESQSLATTARREYTDEEKKIREAILSQYSQLSDNEEEQEHEGVSDNPTDLVKNTNAADVAAAARERREQARLEAQRKKEKDKEDRIDKLLKPRGRSLTAREWVEAWRSTADACVQPRLMGLGASETATSVTMVSLAKLFQKEGDNENLERDVGEAEAAQRREKRKEEDSERREEEVAE